MRIPASNSICERRGFVLLEVMLAVAILGLAMTGFVVALDHVVSASVASRRDAELRQALQSRMAEMKAESVTTQGTQEYEYSGGRVIVDETIGATNLRNARDQELSGMYRIGLTARFREGSWPPMNGEILVYQP
jgi:prepilin-type N-terminal cleavage/methylation domain-containing protein